MVPPASAAAGGADPCVPPGSGAPGVRGQATSGVAGPGRADAEVAEATSRLAVSARTAVGEPWPGVARPGSAGGAASGGGVPCNRFAAGRVRGGSFALESPIGGGVHGRGSIADTSGDAGASVLGSVVTRSGCGAVSGSGPPWGAPGDGSVGGLDAMSPGSGRVGVKGVRPATSGAMSGCAGTGPPRAGSVSGITGFAPPGRLPLPGTRPDAGRAVGSVAFGTNPVGGAPISRPSGSSGRPVGALARWPAVGSAGFPPLRGADASKSRPFSAISGLMEDPTRGPSGTAGSERGAVNPRASAGTFRTPAALGSPSRIRLAKVPVRSTGGPGRVSAGAECAGARSGMMGM